MIQQFHFGCISSRIESRASKRCFYTYVRKVNTVSNVKCLVQTEGQDMMLKLAMGSPFLGLGPPCACDGWGKEPVLLAWVVPTDRCHPNRKPLDLGLVEVPCLPSGRGVEVFCKAAFCAPFSPGA